MSAWPPAPGSDEHLRFKRVYDEAYDRDPSANNGNVFLFEGQQVLLHYGFYVLEYLADRSGRADLKPRKPTR